MATTEQLLKAKALLREIKVIPHKINVRQEEIRTLGSLMKGQTYSDEPRGGETKKMDALYLDAMAKKDKLRQEIDSLYRRRKDLLALFDQLDDSYREILEGIYVAKMINDEVRETLGYGKRNFYNKKSWAIEAFAELVADSNLRRIENI